jgi:hypothetical protein
MTADWLIAKGELRSCLVGISAMMAPTDTRKLGLYHRVAVNWRRSLLR